MTTHICDLTPSGEEPEPADLAAGPAALLEAAAFYESVLQQSLSPDSDPRYCTAVRDVVMGLRRRADEAQAALPVPADRAGLRDRIADAIRAAACPGDCGTTEEECARERIQPFVWHHGRLAGVEGSPEQFADAVLAVLPPTADRTTEVERLTAERDELRAAWNSLVRCANEDAAALVEVGHLVGLSLGERTVSVRTAVEAIGTALRRLADEAQQQPDTETPVHVGGRVNAEDCPACSGTNPPYPFICPGPEAPRRSRTARLLDAVTHSGPGYDLNPAVSAGVQTDEEAEGPRTVCVCGHTRGEHVTISGRLLCDECDPESTDNLVCKEFEAL